MKVLLGDNQFFGVNHFDLEKGVKTKLQFESINDIKLFINKSLSEGIDGFMINSNKKGYELISLNEFQQNKEVHYSIPYPHKYANMINEKGMLSLLQYCYKESSLIKNIIPVLKFVITRDLKHLVKPAINLEVPQNLKKGSYVYLQNIITDLLLGIGREDILVEYIKSVVKMGYKPGLITLNPILVDDLINKNLNSKWSNELILCFNINIGGFNVFPSLEKVEAFIRSRPKYKLMGMSIFSSGGANIPSSIDYIKQMNLDYVVFGTSKIENLKSNLKLLKEKK
jgi:hypothetical protein